MRAGTIPRRFALVTAAASALALVLSGPGLADHGGSSSSHGGSSPGKASATTIPAPAPAPSSGTLSVQGVVQSVSGSAVSVRLLDGTTSSVPYDRKTQVLVNGKTGRIADVRPGFVLVASWKAGRPAAALRFLRPN